MPQPTYTEIHVDAPLTTLAAADFQRRMDAFVALRAFPPVRVQKKSDKYFTFTRADFLRNAAKKRASGAEAARTGYTVSTDTYDAERFALEHPIADPDRAAADAPLQLERQGVEFLALQLAVAIEVQFATDFFATSVWNADTTPTTTWDDDSSDPIGDIDTRRRTMIQNTGGLIPNKLILGLKVFDDLRRHPDILDLVKYMGSVGNPAVVTPQALAAVFGVEEVLVPMASKNTGAEGGAASYSSILGARNALLIHVPRNPGVMIPSAGYTFIWPGGRQGADPRMGTAVYRYRDDVHESDVLGAELWFDNKAVSTVLGEYFSNAVAA